MKNIKMVIGSIEKQNTQVIVNPTNKYMLWEDKTCNGCIMGEFGDDMVKKCELFISKNGPLKMNGIFWYEVNNKNLHTDFVLNIYPPFWQPAISDHNNIENLYDCYNSCFKSCVKNNRVESISLPLIGSGTFGYPIRASYKLLENVIRDNDYSVFKEIRVIFWTVKQFNECRDVMEIWEEIE